MALHKLIKPPSLSSPSLRLPPLPSIRDLVKLYKLKAIKQLSQNFLLDEKLTSKIVKYAGRLGEESYVCEVGPGPGGITRSILQKNPKKLILIEKDRRFASPLNLLKQCGSPGQVDIYWGDVLSFEMSRLFPPEAKRGWEEDDHCPIHVIGNLPFSIATPLIIRWLDAISKQKNVWEYGRAPLTLTFQFEVAERLVAEPDNIERRSRLSIMAQYLCHVYHKFTIKGTAFVPKPEVDVGVVKFVPRKVPLIKQEFHLIEKVVRHTFSMRQKYCRRGVATLFPEMVRTHFTLEMFRRSGVVTTRRPFQLTIEEFESLCNVYAELSREHPQLYSYHYRGFNPDEEWESLHGPAYEHYRIDDDNKIRDLDPPEEKNKQNDSQVKQRRFVDEE